MIQLLTNIILSAAILLLIAMSFNIIYQITKFFHFAHAAIITYGAYFTYLFSQTFGLSHYVSIPLSVLSSCLLGSLMELIIYKPLRKKNSSSLILLLASLGIYSVLQNIISMVFGDDTRSIRTWIVVEGLNVFGARVTPVQIITIATSLILVSLLSGFFFLSKIGKTMRAVANDPELANISGIYSKKVILFSFAIGSSLAGLAGILISLDVDMTPNMGMNYLMMGVVAMIIGGAGKIWGIILGSLLLALAQNIGGWYMNSQWQDAISFVILLIFLLIKPEGFLGKKLKKIVV